MNLSYRMKRITKVMEEKQRAGRKWQYIVQDFGESQEDAIKRSGLDPNDDCVIIVKFSDKKTWPLNEKKPETLETVNRELEIRKSQLRQAEAIKTEEDSVSNSDVTLEAPEYVEKDKLLKIESMRADPFLMGMGR